MVWRTDRGLYEGQPTCEQLLLREKMSELTVGRDPNKAAEGTLTWVTLGAEVDGEAGWGWELDGVPTCADVFEPWAAGWGVGPY